MTKTRKKTETNSRIKQLVYPNTNSSIGKTIAGSDMVRKTNTANKAIITRTVKNKNGDIIGTEKIEVKT